MHNYNINDFLRYYTGSFLVHPRTGNVVKVLGPDKETGASVRLSDKTNVTLEELDWKHVQTPQLGYRSLQDGRLLYYVTRRPSRLTTKGVTPEAIVIEVPPMVQQIADMLGYGDETTKNARLETTLAESIYNPEFKKLEEAVELLSSRKHAIAWALSNNWAVSIGLHDSAKYFLHFKNARVASSKDGKRWKFIDEDSEYIFNRSSL